MYESLRQIYATCNCAVCEEWPPEPQRVKFEIRACRCMGLLWDAERLGVIFVCDLIAIEVF